MPCLAVLVSIETSFTNPKSPTIPRKEQRIRGARDATAMVEGHVAVICAAVDALALAAAALGIVGEATGKSKATRARTHPSTSCTMGGHHGLAD